MSFFDLFVIGVGLSMDAFAVAVCKGLSLQKLSWSKAALVGAYFGAFQAGMPLLGYLLGTSFKNFITAIDHWIAFILLTVIGLNMIKESRNKDETGIDDDLSVKTMVLLAISTSIDALAVGCSFAFLNVNIFQAVTIIGITTFVLSMAGVYIGHLFGMRYRQGAELAGGIILILMGTKILLEHLGIL